MTGKSSLIAADTILAIHVGFVIFVILGLLLVFIGHALSWHWVRNPVFRVIHLLAVLFVVLQSWLGMICPLTTWEMQLRRNAGDAVYTGSFISHWLQELLYYQAPAWVFVVCYTLFGMLVILSWVWVRPRPFVKGIKGK
jgi:hypothetical protein